VTTLVEVPTPAGPARLHVDTPDADGGAGVLVLGHGAGGGVGALDLVAAAAAAVAQGWRAVRVEQPWRVAGRRVAPAPPRLDEAWQAVLPQLDLATAGPLVVGGRSAGARVACRTATATGAAAVLCLAFPLHPPGRPDRSRAPELAGAGRPVVVVQGVRDAFGGSAEIAALGLPGVEILEADADHSMAPRPAAARDALASVVGLAVRRAIALSASGGSPGDRGRPPEWGPGEAR
jgi:predicted alpha/beta-hydrolase family hydrolase